MRVDMIQASGHIVLNKLAARSVLGQPLMQWAIAFAAAKDFNSASSQLMELVRAIFQTWLQSRINEQANKILRDSMHTLTRSKVLVAPLLTCAYNNCGSLVAVPSDMDLCFCLAFDGCSSEGNPRPLAVASSCTLKLSVCRVYLLAARAYSTGCLAHKKLDGDHPV
jgi:hypothetical protein